MPIYAEAKLGELIKSSSKGTFKKGGETFLPTGISKRTSHHAQAIAARTIKDHPEIVAKIKAQAREKLSSRYHRDGSNAPSWNQYCIDIGIPKSTANRWLAGMIRYSRG